jgi:predicted SAM-dependent methyltransferase
LNIDKYKSDIWHDLRKSIPLKPESVDEFYSSHFLEHLSPDDLAKLLDHILKLLKKNGKFLICVPNIRIYIEAYMAGDRIRKGDEYYNHYNTETKLDELNYMAHMNGEHKYLFDEENIISMLEKVGFSKVLLRDFDHKIDLEHHKFESIYVEAIK